MKTKPTGIPLVGQPQSTEQAGVDVGKKQEPPQVVWYKLQHFPWLYRLGSYSNNGTLFPHFVPLTQYPWELYSPGSPPIHDI